MKVLIVNTSEQIGGAAIAARRLMCALQRHGAKVRMLVRDRQTERLSVLTTGTWWAKALKFVWERVCIFVANGWNRKNLFKIDIANTGFDITRLPAFRDTDIIHLHWVNQGFLSLHQLHKILHSGKPVVITLHDQWHFTGVCHYSGECVQYRTRCGSCPLMGGRLAGRVFDKKAAAYQGAPVTFVGCSEWMAGLARQARLTQGHRVVSIPNPIDTTLFAPQDKAQARETLHLPADKQLILFSCQRITDPRKGFSLLAEAIRILAHDHELEARRMALVVVGGAAASVAGQVNIDTIPISYVSDPQTMVALYGAVDIYVTPSLQDNLPNTIMEAMACGTPCVGFRVGGIPELIDHQQNGYVAECQNAADLAQGIWWTLHTDYGALSRAARAKVEERYSEDVVAKQYMAIYHAAR